MVREMESPIPIPESLVVKNGSNICCPKKFSRSDLEGAVVREFCADCGTHLATRPPGLPAVVVKVGTLDEPGEFGGAQMAIYTVDKQAFHHIPDGLPTFERLPPR
jgi:hypothetical protein